jgi:DME family drug/metabolite transporter
LWGVSASLVRAIFIGKLPLSGEVLHPIDPLILSQTRTSFSLLVLLPVLILRSGWTRIRLPAPDLRQCIVLGVLGVAASNYFYYVAVQKTSVAVAVVLQYTAPVWVLIYVVARRRQKLSLQKVAAVAVAITGIALTIGLLGSKSAPLRFDSYGILAALLASFSFAFYNVGGHRILARYDRWRVLVWTLLSASVLWLIINPPWKILAAHYAAAQWAFLFIFSMISVLGAFSLYFLGLQHLEPARAIIAGCLEPVFSILLAAALLREGVRSTQLLGIALVLSAIVIVQLPGRGAAGREAVVVDPIE